MSFHVETTEKNTLKACNQKRGNPFAHEKEPVLGVFGMINFYFFLCHLMKKDAGKHANSNPCSGISAGGFVRHQLAQYVFQKSEVFSLDIG